ncbi:MAG: hypothetical protein ACRD8W_29480 [Nitrososphaeraceae archaeon]
MRSIEIGQKSASGFFVFALILLMGFNSPIVLGHNFSANETAKFLGLVDMIKGEAQLVQDDLANKNLSLANQHANRALALVTDNVTKEIAERNPRLSDDLNSALDGLRTSTINPSMANDINFTVSDLNGLLDEIVTARIDPDNSNNSTIQALRLVEILDGVLRNYGDAYAVGFDMTNMSMMMAPGGSGGMSSMEMGTSGNMSNGEMKTGMQVRESTTEGATVGMQRQSEPSMGGVSMSMDETSSSSQQPKIVNITDYQTAKILASEAQGLFTNQLMNATMSGTTEKVINDIAVAFNELTSSINEKASPMDIMMIVHTKIHPNLVTAFGLQLGKSA